MIYDKTTELDTEIIIPEGINYTTCNMENLDMENIDKDVFSSNENYIKKNTVSSFYLDFSQNFVKLSNPNKSGSSISVSMVKSESSTLFVDNSERIENLLLSQEKKFCNMLKYKANDDENFEANNLLENILDIYPLETKLWVQTIFNKNSRNEKIVLGIIKLLQDFDFIKVSPVAETIAAACKNHKSYLVKSATLSLLGHWCNNEALNIITAFEEPKEMLLRIKYNKLKEIILSKCTISEK